MEEQGKLGKMNIEKVQYIWNEIKKSRRPNYSNGLPAPGALLNEIGNGLLNLLLLFVLLLLLLVFDRRLFDHFDHVV